jgi:hypothetical protein
MSNPKWKAYERNIAKRLGGIRTTNSKQSQNKGIGDIDLSPKLLIEVKDVANIKVLYIWKKVSDCAKISKKLPILVFKSPIKGEGPLILLRLKDLEVLYERLNKGPKGPVTLHSPEGDSE